MKKPFPLRQQGFTHVIALVIIVLVAAIGGTYYLVASHADAPRYVKYSWSSCVYDTASSPAKHLSPSQWAAVGNPSPVTVAHITGDYVLHYATNPSALYLVQPDASCGNHYLTLSEWQAMGSPAAVSNPARFYKSASNPTIYSGGVAISYPQWTLWGSPSPVISANPQQDSITPAVTHWTTIPTIYAKSSYTPSISACYLTKTTTTATVKIRAIRPNSSVVSQAVVWSAYQQFDKLAGSKDGATWTNNVNIVQATIPLTDYLGLSYQTNSAGYAYTEVNNPPRVNSLSLEQC
ncbi:MAG: hypothetical protein JWN38_835 [Candidatus Saccharibacteria bacterium]|nr:hypothetical protein [Candidatus Saccharibacteria bacterium]